jgi:hypothetical protein
MRFDPESDQFGDNIFGDIEKYRKQRGLKGQRFAKLVGDEVVECPFSEWIKIFGDRRHRVIKQDQVGDRYWVSTVFLGLHHGFMDARGVWFETMIFDGYGTDEQYGHRPSIYCERHSTMAEARRGHLAGVDHAQKLLAGATE